MDDQTRTKTVMQALRLFENGQSVQDIKLILFALLPKHNKVNLKMIVEKSIKMYCSLQEAVDEAGGCGFKIDMLCKMTVIELISTLGINNVRFIYTKRNKENTEQKYKYLRCKLSNLEAFAKNMLFDFKKQLKTNPDNLVAAMATDIYEEIIKKLNDK